MNTVATDANEYDAINKIIQVYIEGAKSGNSAIMSPAFHKDTTIFGYIGPDLFAGPIQKLFDWNNENGPATDLQAQIANVDLFDTVATLRLELTNWTGFRFTDLFTLLKIDGKWKIMNKVFHLHS